MPTVSDLDTAMAQPALSVPALRRLGGGSLRVNDSGRPLRAVGRDAVVYELRTPTGRILALRCLLRPDPRRDNALAERYVALGGDPHLERLRGADRVLPREIRWIAEGVALPGPDLHREMTPMMAMERVPGRPLLHAVDRLCREQESGPLALLADTWLATTALLEGAGFSHGDLAADNLIVRPDGSIALVDLDTVAWAAEPTPAVTGGTPGYAHPRGATHDPAHRDCFPALIIWASLRILARHPHLRERWGDPPDRHGGALLWSAVDLRQPSRSTLFAALDALADEPLRPLLEVVHRALRFSPDETPPLPEIAERLETLGFPSLASVPEARRRRPKSAPSPAVPPAQAPAGAPPPAWNDAALLARVPTPAASPRSQEITTPPVATTPEERVAARQLAAAVAARDTAMVTRLWRESKSIPEVAAQAPAVHRLLSQEAAAAIDRAARRRDDNALVAAITAAEREGVAPPLEARRASRTARHRIAARTALGQAIDRGDLRALATLAYSGQLNCLDRLDAAQTRAVERARAWPALEHALMQDDDAAIVAAVDPALWREPAALPPRARERIDLAHRRLRWLEDVRTALRRREGTLLRGLLASAPPGAEQRLSEVESRRILRVSMRDAAVTRLERALREGPDREVADALAELTAAGGLLPAVLDWTAVRGVVDRITLADALRAAASADPPDTARLARLLPAARAALGESTAPDDIDWTALERSVLRAAHLARLRETIAADDDARIALAADPDPYDTLPLLTPDESERVRAALARTPLRH